MRVCVVKNDLVVDIPFLLRGNLEEYLHRWILYLLENIIYYFIIIIIIMIMVIIFDWLKALKACYFLFLQSFCVV